MTGYLSNPTTNLPVAFLSQSARFDHGNFGHRRQQCPRPRTKPTSVRPSILPITSAAQSFPRPPTPPSSEGNVRSSRLTQMRGGRNSDDKGHQPRGECILLYLPAKANTADEITLAPLRSNGTKRQNFMYNTVLTWLHPVSYTHLTLPTKA